jgi:hypothetical protein
MEHVYDEEQDKIRLVGQNLQNKYNYILGKMDFENPMAKRNRDLLAVWHDEVIHRYHQIGFIVECDITPVLAGIGTPTIDIVDRVNRNHEFDFEKKGWEVDKHREDKDRYKL